MARSRSDVLYIMDMPWPAALMAAMCACVFFGVVGARVIYKPYRAPSGSMQPTVRVGDMMIVDKFAYSGGRTPQRGDVVVHREEDLQFVKRVVAVAGDRVQLVAGVLHVNGAAATLRATGTTIVGDYYGAEASVVPTFEERIAGGAPHEVFDRGPSPGDDTALYTLRPGEVFVLGDDRDNSRDSRLETGGYGPAPERDIVGKVVRILPTGAR